MRILATLLLLSVALPAAAQNHPRIAVMPLKAKRIEKDVVFIMDALLVSQLSRLGQFEVISATDIQAMLEAEGMKDALGCDEVTCAAEIGGALNARSTLTGTVGKLGRTIVINLTLFDNEKMVALNRSTVEVEDDENLFAQAVRQVLGSLFDVAVPPASRVSRRPQPQGTPSSLPANNLEVTTDPPGAYVIIDGKLAGQTPIARRLDFGEYTMHIEREGYVPVVRRFRLRADEPFNEAHALEEGEAKGRDWAWWTGGGLLVGGAALFAVSAALLSSSESVATVGLWGSLLSVPTALVFFAIAFTAPSPPQYLDKTDQLERLSAVDDRRRAREVSLAFRF